MDVIVVLLHSNKHLAGDFLIVAFLSLVRSHALIPVISKHVNVSIFKESVLADPPTPTPARPARARQS
jgi:hypothetical protein